MKTMQFSGNFFLFKKMVFLPLSTFNKKKHENYVIWQCELEKSEIK